MDNYEIERELDKGSYGTVFLAIDKRTQQKVAVKIVDKKKIRELGKERHIMREKNLL
jgi:serine/threonine protein kinase